MKRRALRRTAGPGTAAAGLGRDGGDPARAGKRSQRAGSRALSPWEGRQESPRGAGVEGASSVLREDDAGAAGRLGPPPARLPRLPACPAVAFAGGGPRP